MLQLVWTFKHALLNSHTKHVEIRSTTAECLNPVICEGSVMQNMF